VRSRIWTSRIAPLSNGPTVLLGSLQLSAELRGWDDPHARRVGETYCAPRNPSGLRIKNWVPSLTIRFELAAHDQTAPGSHSA